MEAARKVKEEVESTSEDCSEELIQLEVGSCPHTHTHTHAHTHMVYMHILVTCAICSGCGSGLRGERLVTLAHCNVIIT